nr:MAG TPA: hypothetical protein [Caudoviricetes sp.]
MPKIFFACDYLRNKRKTLISHFRGYMSVCCFYNVILVVLLIPDGLSSDGLEQIVQIIARTSGRHQISMPNYVHIVGSDAIVFSYPANKVGQRFNLCLCGGYKVEVATHMNPYGVRILSISVRSDCIHGPSLFNGAVFTNHKVIADSCPSLCKVGFMDFFCGQVIIFRIARVMNHNHVRGISVC